MQLKRVWNGESRVLQIVEARFCEQLKIYKRIVSDQSEWYRGKSRLLH
ncbi:hypothetical protein [Liquorilactobacillus vini]|nr:hypothetical protein [Liquorilactobacillus vini]